LQLKDASSSVPSESSDNNVNNNTNAVETMNATGLHKSDRTNTLAGSKAGRVILHSLCLLRHPSSAWWHWQGILRELRRSTTGLAAA